MVSLAGKGWVGWVLPSILPVSVSQQLWGGCRGSRLSGFANGYGVNTPCEADFLLQLAGRECGVRTCEQAPAHPGQAPEDVTVPCTPAARVPAPRGCSSQQGPLLPPLPAPRGLLPPLKAHRGVVDAAAGLRWVCLKHLHLHEL